ERFSAASLRTGADRIRAAFAELGFLNTQVALAPSYRRAPNEVDVTVTVEPGPFTLVEVRGFDLSETEIRELVPVFEEGSIDADLIEEGRTAILEHVRRQGYFAATVASELIEAPLDDAFQINYTVSPGQRHTVRSVRIEG